MKLINRAVLCLLPTFGLGLLAAPAPAQFLDSIPHSARSATNELYVARNAVMSLCPRLALGENELNGADFGLQETVQMMASEQGGPKPRGFVQSFDGHTVRVTYDPREFTCKTLVSWSGVSRMPTMRNIEQEIRRHGFHRLSQNGGRSEYEKRAPDGESYWYYVIEKEVSSYSITFMVER